jgi:cobalamin biosynthesis protein CobT
LLSGDLDEGSLHKLQYDSEHIWSQKTIAKLPDVAVGILVDQSGSMSCGGKIDNAREMCIVLAEAVKQINGVHLHIYGHTANQGGASDLTLFEHYSSYGDAKAADLTNLGAIAAYSNNYDGYAIKEAAKRLNLDPAKRK